MTLHDGEASGRSTPPVPPGFERQLSESRRATPTIPPGLTKPNALPNLDDGSISRPGSRASLRRQASTAQIVPALPLRPATPSSRTATPAKIDGRRLTEEGTPTKASKVTSDKGKKPLVSDDQTDETVKPVKSEQKSETAEKENVVEAAAIKTEKSIQVESKKASQESVADIKASKNKKKEASTISVPTPVTPEKTTRKEDDQKRKHPGKLDITAAVTKRDLAINDDDSTPVDTSTPTRSGEASTPGKLAEVAKTLSQRVAMPPPGLAKIESSGASVSSPIYKTAPRTLRVVQTPKTEVPASQLAAGLPSAKLPSRKPSISSIHFPGTPTSEHISLSDNISMTSTSMSRANSPPPSRVGSAPVRAKTKSQVKKERQERGKTGVQVEESARASLDESVHEAILSRKKKAKKGKEPKPKAKPVTPVQEQVVAAKSVSPKVSPIPEKKEKVEEVPVAPVVTQPVVSPPAPSMPVQVQTPVPAPHEPSPPPTPTLTAASILADIKAQTPELQKCIDSLFRTPTNPHLKPQQPITANDLQNSHFWKPDFKLNISENDVDALLRGDIPAINYGGEDGRMWDRGLVTGNGAHIRALTAELEQRFLELEKALNEMPDDLRFRPSKPQNETKFPTIDLEGLKRQFENSSSRGVSVMEQMVQDGSTMKKGAFLVDEASKYVNEFVMPPTPPTPSAQLQQTNDSRGGAHGFVGQPKQQQSQQASDHTPPVSVNIEIADRQLSDARRVAEEKEAALRKVIKKNRKLLGLG